MTDEKARMTDEEHEVHETDPCWVAPENFFSAAIGGETMIDRTALAKSMHDAIVSKLLKPQPAGTAKERIFRGIDGHVVLMAIADLGVSLLCDYADGDVELKERRGSNWEKLIDEVADEMRRILIDGDPSRPKLVLVK